jgi:hypothetical protein
MTCVGEGGSRTWYDVLDCMADRAKRIRVGKRYQLPQRLALGLGFDLYCLGFHDCLRS